MLICKQKIGRCRCSLYGKARGCQVRNQGDRAKGITVFQAEIIELKIENIVKMTESEIVMVTVKRIELEIAVVVSVTPQSPRDYSSRHYNDHGHCGHNRDDRNRDHRELI